MQKLKSQEHLMEVLKREKNITRLILCSEYQAYMTQVSGDNWKDVGIVKTSNGKLQYTAPAQSVTTFFAQ